MLCRSISSADKPIIYRRKKEKEGIERREVSIFESHKQATVASKEKRTAQQGEASEQAYKLQQYNTVNK